MPPCDLAFRDEGLEHLALVIDGAPEVMTFAIDLHEDLVDMPSPVASPARI